MEKVKPLISVIVPVYNVSEYLEECVRSIVAQTYSNLEIVLVDDGSTDDSGKLADVLAKSDERIVVLHKANGGLSDARNYGLSYSHGAWISFIDSDDYVSPVFIEALYKAVESCNCKIAAVTGGHPFKDGESCSLIDGIEAVCSPRVLAEEDVQRAMLYQSIFTGAQWRLYSKETLGDNPFPVGLYYEDLASTYKFIHAAGSIAILDCRDLYAYRMRDTSIIRQSYRHIKGLSALAVSNQISNDIPLWYPKLREAVSSRCFSVCRMVYGQVPSKGSKRSTDETKRDADKLWKVIKKNRNVVLGDPKARKRERLAALIAYFGRQPFTCFCAVCRRFGKMQ